MVHWKDVLTQLTPDAEGRMAELRGQLSAQLGGVGPIKVIAFRGYGTERRLYLRGRVIEEKLYLPGEKNDRVWAELVNIYTRARAEGVPNACLSVRFQNTGQMITADENGFFEARFEPKRPLVERRLWHPVELQLLNPIPEMMSRYPVKTMGEVLVPPSTAHFGVISNIDHTLLPASSNHLLYVARSTFLRNPQTRHPFAGEAALYRAFYAGSNSGDASTCAFGGGEMNPLFYVSITSGSLYDLLVQHINLQNLPSGPVLFTPHNRIQRLRQIFGLYPHLPFLLIGDSEEDDAEMYTTLACEFPGRIPAIYIRDSGSRRRAAGLRALAGRAKAAGSQLVLAADAMAIARHAVDLGLLPATALTAVYEDMQKDEAPYSPVERLLAEPEVRAPKVARQEVKKGAARDESDPVSSRQPEKKNK